MERVLEARIKLLQDRLKIALEQRDTFVQKYFKLAKVPYAERQEIIEEYNRELERAGAPQEDASSS